MAGNPVEMNGLPTSSVTDMGNHFALRAQRVAFQQWKVDVPWASAGEVTVALSGDIAKELDLLPDKAALQPIEAPKVADEGKYPNLRTLPPFCLFDTARIMDLPGSPPFTVYRATCGNEVQGISVGWGDVYESTLVDQWIEVGTEPLPSGEYVLRSVADPLNRIHERPEGSDPTREDAEDNEAAVAFTITNGVVTNLRILQANPSNI